MRISDWSSDVCSSDLLRMLQDSAPAPHAGQRRLEASAVIANPQSPPQLVKHRAAIPITPPPLAWRVRDHRMRTGIGPRIALAVPGIDAIKVPIDAAAPHEKGGHQEDTNRQLPRPPNCWRSISFTPPPPAR